MFPRRRAISALIAIVVFATPTSIQSQPSQWNWELVSAGFPPPGYPFGVLTSIHARSATDVFLAGCYRCLFRWDGTSFTSQLHPDGANRYSVDGTLGGPVYSAGQAAYQSGNLIRFDGSSWTTVLTTPVELFASWVADDGSVFAVGDGVLYANTGSGFRSVSTGLSSAFNTDRLQAIAGFSRENVFMGGYGGKILRYDGTAVTLMETGTTETLWAMDGSSESNLFAVGEKGTVLSYDGIAWRNLPSPTPGRLVGVKAFGPNSVLVTGDNGVVSLWNGSTWNTIDFNSTNTFYGIDSPDNGNTLFVVEATNQDVRFRLGRAVTPTSTVPEPSTAVLSVAGLLCIGAVARRNRGNRKASPLGTPIIDQTPA